MASHRGISRADLLALLVALPVLFFMACGDSGQNKLREASNRADCAANLAGISKALNVYANCASDTFPLVPSASSTKYAAALKPNAVDEHIDPVLDAYYRKEMPLQNGDVTANQWLVVLRSYTAPNQYICKSDPFAAAKVAALTDENKKYYNNFSEHTMSYSFVFPWRAGEKGEPPCAAICWTNIVDERVPIGSDMAPYLDPKGAKDEVVTRENMVIATGETQPDSPSHSPPAADDAAAEFLVNSQNHGAAGMNVAYSDAHVSWERRPDVGQNQDNIWTVNVEKKEKAIAAGDIGAEIKETKDNEFDIVMVPVRDAKGNVK